MNNVIAFSRRNAPVDAGRDEFSAVRTSFETLVVTIDAAVIQIDQMIRLIGPELAVELMSRREALADEARIIRTELRALEAESLAASG